MKNLSFILLSSLFISHLQAQPVEKFIEVNKTPVYEPTYTSSADVISNIAYSKKEKTYFLELVKNNGIPLTTNDLLILPSGNYIDAHWTNTLFNKIEDKGYDIDGMNTIFSLKPSKNKGECEAFYVTYQLRGDKVITTKALILDDDGNVTNKLDEKCPVSKRDFRNNIQFTENNYTVGFNWSSPSLNTIKPVKFNSTFTKEGFEYIPENLKAYAVSNDFTHFYSFEKLPTKGAYHGINFSQNIEYPNTYNFLLTFDGDNGKTQTVTARGIVNQGSTGVVKELNKF